MRILKKAVSHITHEYTGLELERQAVCPLCLAKKPIGQASVWDHSTITALRTRGEQVIRCRYGHMNDVRLICGSADEQPQALPGDAQASSGGSDIPVSDLLKAVVIVGIWDEKAQRIVRAGSGFIVDKKRGFVVTAGHTLMDRQTWREVKGKIVIGVVPGNSSRADPVAVYRYFARILVKDPSIDESGICKLDACVLQITTRMEHDVLESGKEIGEYPNGKSAKQSILSSLFWSADLPTPCLFVHRRTARDLTDEQPCGNEGRELSAAECISKVRARRGRENPRLQPGWRRLDWTRRGVESMC